LFSGRAGLESGTVCAQEFGDAIHQGLPANLKAIVRRGRSPAGSEGVARRKTKAMPAIGTALS